MNHRYILEPYKGMNSRYHCPQCHYRVKTFTRYIDIVTGKHIASNVGRCSRENTCKYHYTPKQYFQDNHFKVASDSSFVPYKKWEKETVQKSVFYVPIEIFNSSLTSYEPNNFIKYLIDLFGLTLRNNS